LNPRHLGYELRRHCQPSPVSCGTERVLPPAASTAGLEALAIAEVKVVTPRARVGQYRAVRSVPAATGHSPLLLNWYPSQAEIDGARSCGTWPSTTAVTFCRPLAAAMQGNLRTEREQTPDSNQRLTEPAESERPPVVPIVRVLARR
jgi:hypothetical protein